MSNLTERLLASTTKPHGLQKLGENLARSSSRNQARQDLTILADSQGETLRLAAEECREWFEATCEHRSIVRSGGFSVGGVGYGGQLPWLYLVFLRKLATKDASRRFQRDLQSEYKIYQLYGLLGLSETDSLAFQKALPSFQKDTSRIYTMSGCVGIQRSMSDVATEIAKGSYREAIARGTTRHLFLPQRQP